MEAEKQKVESYQITITMNRQEATDLVELLQAEKNRRYGEKLMACWDCYNICESLLESLNEIGIIAIGGHDRGGVGLHKIE